MREREDPMQALTYDDMAKILRCAPRTIARRVEKGTIRKMEGLGRLVRFHPSEPARLAGLEWRDSQRDDDEFPRDPECL